MTAPTTDTAPAPLPAAVQESNDRQALRAAEILALEYAAVRAVTGPLRRQLVAVQRSATRAWIAMFASLDAPGDPIRAATVAAQIRGDLARISIDASGPLAGYTQRALTLGVEQAAKATGTTLTADGIGATVDAPTAQLVAGLDQTVAGAIADAENAVGQISGANFAEVNQVLAKAHRAVPKAAATTVTAVHGGANAGKVSLADFLGADLLWLAEPDACCVPGTRVSAPSLLLPRQAPMPVVALDEANGLAPDPSALGVGAIGDGRLTATSAMAVAVADLSGVLGVSQRDYVGEVITVFTANGKEFTGTPNHPVATRAGWVGLAELQVGDYIFSRRRHQPGGTSINPNLDDVQPCIEEVAESFQRVVPSRVMPVSAEDFHGDGVGTQVGVVWAHRLLRDCGDTAISQKFSELDLELASRPCGAFEGLGLRDSRIDAHLLALHDNGHPGGMFGSLLGRPLVSPAEVSANGQPVAFEPVADGGHVDAIDYGDFLGCLAGLVEPDEIVDIRHGHFSGHVYNLETVEGWYLSEDIVSHNCTTCAGFAGRTTPADQPFDLRFASTFTDKPHLWPPGPVVQPPAHPACRCEIVPWLGTGPGASGLSLPESLQREARRAILKGWSLPSESQPERIRAARKALAQNPAVPKSVKAYARRAVTAGHFPTRDVPHYTPRPRPATTTPRPSGRRKKGTQ